MDDDQDIEGDASIAINTNPVFRFEQQIAFISQGMG